MKNYLVQPKYNAKRTADYKTGEKFNEIFKPISPRSKKAKELFEKFDGLCGNFFADLIYNSKIKQFVKRPKSFWNNDDENKKGLFGTYMVISSALLLYRLICMFKNPIVVSDGANGYKVPWVMYFIHVPTGIIMSFGEWKGGITVHTPCQQEALLNEKLNKDITELLNFIVSDNSPHPYDRCVAGSVA